MTNSTIHKIFMDNVKTIKNIQISNGEFDPDNEVYGKNIWTLSLIGKATPIKRIMQVQIL